jgi:biopolymer transport protein ExbB
MLFDLIASGGPMVWMILGCLMLSLAVTFERLSYFHRASLNLGEFLVGVGQLVKKGNYAEAQHECLSTRVPVGRVMHAALYRYQMPSEQLEKTVQQAAQMEVPRLERFLPMLYCIAHLTPLLGLLGTVVSLIDVFTIILQENQRFSQALVARGVYASLIYTGLGLLVALPSFLFYSFLRVKSKALMDEMERAGIEVLQIIEEEKQER